MIKKNIIFLLFVVLSIYFIQCRKTVYIENKKNRNINDEKKEIVKINKKENYYEVIINAEGNSHRKIGEEYGKQILKNIPDMESIIDSYISEITNSERTYNVFINRIQDFKQNLHRIYKNEIEGMASVLSSTSESIKGDGKISVDELYMLNFIPDIARSTQCSAFSVFGSTSSTGKTITGRNLDWYAGRKNQLCKTQAVIIINNGNKSICSIGYLGFQGILTGCNDNKVFAAIMDAKTGNPYSSKNKKSYSFDLRHALENYSSMDEIADYMINPSNSYAFGHLIILSDKEKSIIIENDLSSNKNRRIRFHNSKLITGIKKWPSKHAEYSIGAVNSFTLMGNSKKSSEVGINVNRWKSMINQTKIYSENKITYDELKSIITYDADDGPDSRAAGDLYNLITQQIIIFQPDNLAFEIFFRPENGKLPDDPVFQKINIIF